MKTITYLLSLLFISLFIYSCSITEEITFNTNGSLNYSYLIDGSNFMKMMPDSTYSKEPKIKDSLISLYSILESQKDSISKLPLEEQKKIAALKSLNIRMYQNDSKKEFFVQLFGDFKNISDLNSALAALNTVNNTKNNPKEKMEFMANSIFEWNGKKLIKTSFLSDGMKTDSSAQNLVSMFSGGSYKVKYNFPKKIEKVNNSDAVISKDRKSVSIEYDAKEYLSSPEKTNLEIELEK